MTSDDYEDAYGLDDYEPDCMTCDGDGFEECETTTTAEGCWESDCDGYHHRCPNCHGSGLAKDQRFW